MSTAFADTTLGIPAGVWKSDATHSSAGFAIRAVATFRGTFADIDATLTVDQDGIAALTGSIDAASIVLKNEQQKAHLASPDFFDIAHYPQMRFTASAIGREGNDLQVSGDLTIKDRTHPIQARGTIYDPVVALSGDTRLGMTLETVIDRRRYGVAWNAPMPKGGMVLGNDVTITIELDFERSDAEA